MAMLLQALGLAGIMVGLVVAFGAGGVVLAAGGALLGVGLVVER